MLKIRSISSTKLACRGNSVGRSGRVDMSVGEYGELPQSPRRTGDDGGGGERLRIAGAWMCTRSNLPESPRGGEMMEGLK